jgi:hypothetical protein
MPVSVIFAHQQFFMEESTISLVLSIIAIVVSLFVLFLSRPWKEENKTATDFSTRPLQLQAYESLVLLCERISLPRLISRVSQPGLSARDMQVF